MNAVTVVGKHTNPGVLFLSFSLSFQVFSVFGLTYCHTSHSEDSMALEMNITEHPQLPPGDGFSLSEGPHLFGKSEKTLAPT